MARFNHTTLLVNREMSERITECLIIQQLLKIFPVRLQVLKLISEQAVDCKLLNFPILVCQKVHIELSQLGLFGQRFRVPELGKEGQVGAQGLRGCPSFGPASEVWVFLCAVFSGGFSCHRNQVRGIAWF